MAESAGARPTVVYIGGSGRSGSTLLECMLAELPDVVVLGEVAHLWERGLLGNELCACSQPFHSCPFWQEVGDIAFGGWRNVDGRRMLALQDAVDRQRRLVSTLQRTPPRRIHGALAEYNSHYARVYSAARAITGARVVVDSTKESPTVMALSHCRDIDLRVIHIVRDSRGVAFSWQKSVERPEKAGEQMPQLSPAVSTEWWLVHNGGMAGLRRHGVPVARIRYEDLVTEPAAVVGQAWNELSLPGECTLPIDDSNVIDLSGTHSVAGNPMRFRTGPTALRPDIAWIDGLSRRDRAVVTMLSWPLLKAYGYPLRAAA
jgi:hypothetical protein